MATARYENGQWTGHGGVVPSGAAPKPDAVTRLAASAGMTVEQFADKCVDVAIEDGMTIGEFFSEMGRLFGEPFVDKARELFADDWDTVMVKPSPKVAASKAFGGLLIPNKYKGGTR